MASSESIIDKLEDAFIDCLTPCISEETSHGITQQDDSRISVEHAVTKFFDVAREAEAMFVKQGASVAAKKPEAVLRQEIEELQAELRHKDEVLNKFHAQLKLWQTKLNEISKGQPSKLQVPTSANQATAPLIRK